MNLLKVIMAFNQQEYQKKWYQKNKEGEKSKGKIYYEKNKESIKKRIRKYTLANPEKILSYRKKARRVRMSFIFDSLGNICSICGNENKIVLQIDHINGGGTKHHREIKGSISSYYKSIADSIKNKEGKYRLLCANCNISEAVRMGFRNSTWLN